jgi:integrase
MKLLDLWRAFREERSISLAETSLTSDYRQVEQWLERCPIQDPALARQALIWVLQQKPEKSARRVGHYMKTLFRWACSEDVALVARNPIASFKFPKKPQTHAEVVVIPQDLVAEVLWALEQGSPNEARWHLLANFMLQTGLRTAEAFGLQWADVDLAAKRILIHQNFTLTHGLRKRTKTGVARQVPLNPVALRVLTEVSALQLSDEFVFPWNRQSYMSAFRNCMERLRRQGVIRKRFRPYDLRHTHISALLEKGIPVSQIAAWAGNSAAMIWSNYAATTTDYEMPSL